MTVPRISPLSAFEPVVDAQGRPTPFFIRQWLDAQNVTVTVGKTESEVGNLQQIISDLTINDLNDVDTSTIPPAPGQGLVWDGSNWVPGAGAGGFSQQQILARISVGV